MQFRVEPRDFTSNFDPPTYALRPGFRTTLALRITAAAGTKLAGASSSTNVIIIIDERVLQPEGLLHSRGIAGSGFPLSNIPYCCLLGVWACLSPSVADHPLKSAIDQPCGAITSPTSIYAGSSKGDNLLCRHIRY